MQQDSVSSSHVEGGIFDDIDGKRTTVDISELD